MAFIQEKLFESGFNLGAPIFVQGGANGKFAVSANQIAWVQNLHLMVKHSVIQQLNY